MAADEQAKDAFFSFGTDIDSVAGQVESGLGRIERSLGSSHGDAGAKLITGLGAGVKAEVATAIAALKELAVARQRAGADSSHSGPTFAQGADTILKNLRGNIREQVISGATQARAQGADIGSVSLGAVLRDLDRNVLDHLAGISRRLTQEVAQTKNPGLQTAFGQVGDIRKAAAGSYRIGTVDEHIQNLQTSIDEHARREKTAGAAAGKLADASNKAADEVKKAGDEAKKVGGGAGGGQRPPNRATGGGAAGDGGQGGGSRGRGGSGGGTADDDGNGPTPPPPPPRRPSRARLDDAEDELAGDTKEESKAAKERAAKERALSNELNAAAEDPKRQARRLEDHLDTGVRRLGGGRFAVDTDDGLDIAVPARSGGTRFLNPEKAPSSYNELVNRDKNANQDAPDIRQREEERAESKRLAEAKRAATEATRAVTEAARAEAAAERELTAAVNEQARRGVFNNFLAGAGSAGLGSNKAFEGNFDGLARSAGQTLKYSSLYQGLGLLQQGAAAAVSEFLDMDDSITELNVAMAGGGHDTADFNNQLQDFAAQGGFNVGEAMDTAAAGIRAFRVEAQASGQDINQLGADYAQQVNRIAVLTKTTLPVASQGLTNIVTGFKLSPDAAGFSQVTDAIAGAKRVGGSGDEAQILAGLAQASELAGQLGFDVNQTATLISKINATTGESGQLAATRLTRIASIFQGATGSRVLGNLNESLGDKDKIDLSADPAQQFQQLARVFNPEEGKRQLLTEQRKRQLLSQLGGQSGSRELGVILEDLPRLTRETDKGFTGEGAKEFEERLKNAREVITQIVGNIRALVTNLASAGLADPFVTLLEVLKPISIALREVSQVINSITGKLGAFRPFLFDAIALGAALKVITSIRQAGGLSQFLTNAETNLRPHAALARAQLTTEAKSRARAASAIREPRTEAELETADRDAIHGRALAEDRLRVAPHDVTGQTKLAAANLEAASVEMERAAINLRVAEQELLAANVLAREETLVTGAVSPATAGRQNKARADLAEARDNLQGRTVNVTERTADLNGAKRTQLQHADLDAAFDKRRIKIQEEYAGKFQAVDRQIDAASQAGNQRRLGERLAERIAIETRHNRALRVVDTEEIAERQRMVLLNRSGKAFSIADGVTGGILGRTAVQREAEGLSNAATVARFGKNASDSIGDAVEGALSSVGGAIGLGTLAVSAGSALYDAYQTVFAAQKEAADVQARVVGQGADALKKASDDNLASASTLKEATKGPIGAIQQFLDDYRGRDQANTQEFIGEQQKAQAGELKALATTEAHSGDPNQLRSAINTTSSQTVADSLKNLSEAGVEPELRLKALIAAITGLGLASGDALSRLGEAQRVQFAGDVGTQVGAGIDAQIRQARDTQDRISGEQVRGFTPAELATNPRQQFDDAQNTLDVLSPFAGTSDQAKTNKANVAAAIKKTTDEFLKTHSDITSDEAQGAYQLLLTQQFLDLQVPPGAIPRLVHAAADAAKQGGTDIKQTLGNIDTLGNLLSSGPQAAADAGAQAAQNAQLAAIRSHTVDTSAAAGTTTHLAGLQQTYSAARSIADLLVASGTASKKQADDLLRPILEQINKATIDQAAAVVTTANSLLADSTKLRQAQQRRADSAADIQAIGQNAFQHDIRNAVNSNNLDVVTQTLSQGNKKEAQAFLAHLKNQQASFLAIAKAAKQRELFLRSIGDTADADRFGHEADSATRSAGAVGGQIDLVGKGIDRANFTNTDDTGSDAGGLTLLGERAARERITAARTRSDLKSKEAALHAAQDAKANARGLSENLAADQALASAKNDYNDALLAQTRSGEDVNARDDIAIDVAARAVRDDDDELKKYTKGTKEYNEALRKKNADLRAQALAEIEAAHILAESQGDVTDAIAEDNRALGRDRKKYDVDAKDPKLTGRARDVKLAEDQNVINGDLNKREADIHSRRLKDAQDLFSLGALSQGAYLQALGAERDRIQTQLAATKEGTNQYVQLKDELTESNLKIKEAAKGLSGQFNLGDIKVPTVYEVRRAIKNATSSTESAVTAANISNAVHNTTITINGADLAAVDALLRKYVGSANRYTPSTRKS